MGGKARQSIGSGLVRALADVAKIVSAHQGRAAVIAQPDDLIIFKAVAWRPVDQQDVERLLALHGERVDLERIRRHVKELGDALEIDRLRDLDKAIARILPGKSDR
jgi:hypothetical protein